MAVFNDYLPTLLRFEGGYVNDPDDPGGPTNMGITLRSFESIGPSLGFTDTSLEALRRLTPDEAGRFYKPKYWDVVDADAIPLQALAEMLVDFHVNAGGNAIRELQQLLNEHGASLRADGAWGPMTAGALARLDPVIAYRGLRARRVAYYERLVAQRPVLGKYLKGWLRRVDTFPVL
ncbi:glycoside hydrolase family 108 protein [Roseateles chitinivorans]|uniref:glycoside hydrolase family 108 protein n=1 Tax=Roseateles chitinivorans TaxID=2917965 RepID=UPI003D677EB1